MTVKETSKIVIIFSQLVVIATTGYGMYVYRSLGPELRRFSHFLFLCGFIQLVSAILWFFKKNNLPLLHFYVAAGFFLLALFYQEILKGFIEKKIIRGLLIIFLLFTVVNSLFLQNIFTFNSYALTAESVLIVILSLSTFMFMMEDIVKKSRPGLVRSLHWINSGLFVYYCSSLLIFYFGNLITLFLPSYLVNFTWMLHSFFSNVMYGFFVMGLWHRPGN